MYEGTILEDTLAVTYEPVPESESVEVCTCEDCEGGR